MKEVLLYFYLGISVITFILNTLIVLKVSHEFKRRYPTLKAPKSSLADKILTFLRVIILCLLLLDI